MTQPPPRPRCLRLEHWAEGDRLGWERGLLPRDRFSIRLPARPRWSDATILKARKSYGVWLSFLMRRDDWDPTEAPAARVSVPRLRAYYWFLCDAGNRPATVTGRFDDLRRALRWMAPEQDWAWVRRPDGQAIRTLQRQTPLPKPLPPDAGVLADWACGMMDDAMAGPQAVDQWLRYRDALFMAMLAWRARRLRSMALLRPGHELRTAPAGYRIELTEDQVKTRKPDRFDLPDALIPYIDHYLAVVRPGLLGGKTDDALWISNRGRKLSAKSLSERVRLWTGARFGKAFGPHLFRHALSTTAVLKAPDSPGLAAALLGISKPVLERHYNLANQVSVTNRFATLIAARRAHYAIK
jgi:site-specific recombinase XerC